MGRWDPTGLEDGLLTKAWTAIKSLFSSDKEPSGEASSDKQQTETNVVEKKMLMLGDTGTSSQVLLFQPNLTEGAAQVLKLVQETQEALDWLDNTIPSWLTLTGSIRTDLDAMQFAIAVLFPEISVYQATLSLCEAAEYGSQLLLGGNTTSTIGLPAPTGSNPWMEGTEIVSTVADKNIIINMAMSKGQPGPGSWGTLEEIPNEEFVRQNLAVTPEFKSNIYGVQQYIIKPGQRYQTGIVGPQNYKGVIYPGGSNQIQVFDKSQLLKNGNITVFE